MRYLYRDNLADYKKHTEKKMDELIKQIQVLSDYILQRKVTFAETDLISEEVWWIKNYKLNFLDWLQIY